MDVNSLFKDRKIYADRKERQKAFEDILIELGELAPNHQTSMLLIELANIYEQAEDE